MSKYTKEDIANALATFNSSEYGDIHGRGAAVTYFLHLDDDGNILPNLDGEKVAFIATAKCSDYGVGEEEWKELWDSDFLSEHENLDCEAFADVVDSLLTQANEWGESL